MGHGPTFIHHRRKGDAAHHYLVLGVFVAVLQRTRLHQVVHSYPVPSRLRSRHISTSMLRHDWSSRSL